MTGVVAGAAAAVPSSPPPAPAAACWLPVAPALLPVAMSGDSAAAMPFVLLRFLGLYAIAMLYIIMLYTKVDWEASSFAPRDQKTKRSLLRTKWLKKKTPSASREISRKRKGTKENKRDKEEKRGDLSFQSGQESGENECTASSARRLRRGPQGTSAASERTCGRLGGHRPSTGRRRSQTRHQAHWTR